MGKITYENKEAINVDTSIPNKNKATADDFNEIKKVVNENEDHQIGIIKDICATLPATTGYVEGDNVYLMNDNLIYTLTNGAWVSLGAPNSNKSYLLLNDYYDSDYGWKYTRGLYKVSSYGYIMDKLENYICNLGNTLQFDATISGTYLIFTPGADTGTFFYPTRTGQTGQITIPQLSTVSIFKQSNTTLTVGDMFVINTADNKTITGKLTATNPILGNTWSIKNYYSALQIRKSTDVSTVNMFQLFKDEAGSPTKTLLWILGNTFTLNYTEYGTQESKSFTFGINDMVQGNSTDCVSGDPMIIYKTNGERYKVTNLTVTGDTYLITKLDEDIFSTSETLTNKKWIDGKPLYRKTIITPGPFTTNTTTIDISGLGAETIMIDSTHSFARFVDSVDDYTIPFDSPACSTGTVAMKAGAIAITDINHYTDEIELYIGSNSLNDSTMILYITLEYTKTTQNQSNTPVITPPDPTPEEEN